VDLCQAHLFLARAQLALSIFAEAEVNVERALSLVRQSVDASVEARCLHVRAEVRWRKGEHERAWADLDRATAICSRSGMRVPQTDCTLSRVRFLIESGDREDGKETLNLARGLIAATDYGIRKLAVQALEQALVQLPPNAQIPTRGFSSVRLRTGNPPGNEGYQPGVKALITCRPDSRRHFEAAEGAIRWPAAAVQQPLPDAECWRRHLQCQPAHRLILLIEHIGQMGDRVHGLDYDRPLAGCGFDARIGWRSVRRRRRGSRKMVSRWFVEVNRVASEAIWRCWETRLGVRRTGYGNGHHLSRGKVHARRLGQRGKGEDHHRRQAASRSPPFPI
jgi:hypothetical protein